MTGNTPPIEPPQTSQIAPQAVFEVKVEETCVTWLRKRIPSLPRGDAIDLPISSTIPRVGLVVKLNYVQGHVGQVMEVKENGIWVEHFMNGEERRDFYLFTEGKILGYWYLPEK